MNLPPMSIWNVVALGVSIVALIIAFLNFRRKSALNIRGYFTWTSSSVAADDQHISSLVVENLKDRAVTIYGIYLRIGHNNYIEIDDFSSKPLVLKAFESWHKEYGAIEFYSCNMHKVSMNALFEDPRARKRIVLSTGDGKYIIRKSPKRWSPVSDSFKNHSTFVLHPIRSNYKDVAVGGKVAYVLDITFDDAPNEVFTLHRTDYRVVKFRNFQLTNESLKTAEALRSFIQEQISIGTLVCKSFEVIDAEEWRGKVRREYRQDPVAATYINIFQYRVLDRLATMHLKRRNK